MNNDKWVVSFNDGEQTLLSRDTKEALEEVQIRRVGTKDNWFTLWPIGAEFGVDELRDKVSHVLSIPPQTVVRDAKWLAECAPKSRIRKALRKLFSRQSRYEVIQEIIAPTYAGTDEEILRHRRFYACGLKVEVADAAYRVEVWRDADEMFISFTPKAIAEEKTTFLRISDDKGKE